MESKGHAGCNHPSSSNECMAYVQVQAQQMMGTYSMLALWGVQGRQGGAFEQSENFED